PGDSAPDRTQARRTVPRRPWSATPTSGSAPSATRCTGRSASPPNTACTAICGTPPPVRSPTATPTSTSTNSPPGSGCSERRTEEVAGRGSDRVRAAFARAHADDRFDRGDPDLAVADLAGAGGADDGGDRTVDLVVVEQHFQAHLGHEVDGVLGAAVDLG